MCENCPEEIKYIKLRFTGGRHKKGFRRGPFLSYKTGEIYEVPDEYIDLPYWEPVGKKDKIKTEEKAKVESIVEEPISLPISTGLTREFKGESPTHEVFIRGMDDELLKTYIEGQGGKVDGRWGRKRLIEEALKLQ